MVPEAPLVSENQVGNLSDSGPSIPAATVHAKMIAAIIADSAGGQVRVVTLPLPIVELPKLQHISAADCLLFFAHAHVHVPGQDLKAVIIYYSASLPSGDVSDQMMMMKLMKPNSGMLWKSRSFPFRCLPLCCLRKERPRLVIEIVVCCK